LLFFKSQSILFLLIPTRDSDLSLFLNGIIGVVIFEAVFLFSEMIKQCSASVFFVDWEQSKGKIQTKANDSELSTISIWRSIFIVNEWSKLQTFRKCNILLTLIGVLFLLLGLNVQNLALLQPQFADMNIAKKNIILLFCSNSLCWMFVLLVQFLFRRLIYERYYRNVMLQFVDLLSLSNISLFGLDERCHGYYVHGRSVHGTADTDMDGLNSYLRQEAVIFGNLE
jgi:meckelin